MRMTTITCSGLAGPQSSSASEERSRSSSRRRRDQAARGHDNPLTILPLDALHPANTGKRAVVGDLEEVALAIFNKCMAAPHAVEDPIRQDLCLSPSRGVRNCACDLGSRSGRSHRALSLLL